MFSGRVLFISVYPMFYKQAAHIDNMLCFNLLKSPRILGFVLLFFYISRAFVSQMPFSLFQWLEEFGTKYFFKSLKHGLKPKTFKKYIATLLTFFVCLLYSFYPIIFWGKYTTLHASKQKYLSKTFQQVIVSQQYFV